MVEARSLVLHSQFLESDKKHVLTFFPSNHPSWRTVKSVLFWKLQLVCSVPYLHRFPNNQQPPAALAATARPQKMIFFKCNSCRTLEEQQTRLRMCLGPPWALGEMVELRGGTAPKMEKWHFFVWRILNKNLVGVKYHAKKKTQSVLLVMYNLK